MTLDNEFKIALSKLPSAEKDKLIFRLLKKDPTLANRLYFELVQTDSIEDCRLELEDQIISSVKRATYHFYSPGILMMEMRHVSGEITTHVKKTKDKYGDISLNLLLLVETLRENKQNLREAEPKKTYKFNMYILNKTFKILIQLKALGEQYYLEFEEPLRDLANLIAENAVLGKASIHNGLDLNWLTPERIPRDISKIYKDLRANDYLK